jgi:GGDEF domain-containing protein
VALHCSRFDDPGSSSPCVIYQLHDITSRHLAEQRLHHIAFHDSLTDLTNRVCFTDRLAQAEEPRVREVLLPRNENATQAA